MAISCEWKQCSGFKQEKRRHVGRGTAPAGWVDPMIDPKVKKKNGVGSVGKVFCEPIIPLLSISVLYFGL